MNERFNKNQIELDLGFEKERDEIAKAYRILDKENLKKVGSEWFLDGVNVKFLNYLFTDEPNSHVGGKY
jgi:hypothetical protein